VLFLYSCCTENTNIITGANLAPPLNSVILLQCGSTVDIAVLPDLGHFILTRQKSDPYLDPIQTFFIIEKFRNARDFRYFTPSLEKFSLYHNIKNKCWINLILLKVVDSKGSDPDPTLWSRSGSQYGKNVQIRIQTWESFFLTKFGMHGYPKAKSLGKQSKIYTGSN